MPILRPLLGQLTQGTLFSCAAAQEYSGCLVHGIVITARCDVEQGKFSILNFLPVVKFDDWLVRDGADILHARQLAATSSSLRETLKLYNISPSILDSRSVSDIVGAFWPEGSDEKGAKQKRDRLIGLERKLGFLSAYEYDRATQVVALLSEYGKEKSIIIAELVNHKIAGHYFLPSVYDGKDDKGYVVLVREVRSLSLEAARAVSEGLDESEAEKISERNLAFIRRQVCNACWTAHFTRDRASSPSLLVFVCEDRFERPSS